jgi:hypothetical protein
MSALPHTEEHDIPGTLPPSLLLYLSSQKRSWGVCWLCMLPAELPVEREPKAVHVSYVSAGQLLPIHDLFEVCAYNVQCHMG